MTDYAALEHSIDPHGIKAKLAGEKLLDEIDPLRTRPDYNLRCDRCGAPHNLDTSIPGEMWNQISGNFSTLCTLCIDDLLTKKGLTCEAEFYFCGRSLFSRIYSDRDDLADGARHLARQSDALRVLRDEADREGDLARPDLFETT